MQPTDRWIEVGAGVRLHVRSWIPAGQSAPPMLLVHGLSSNARLWDQVAQRVAAGGSAAYAVDLRSHGESDRPDTGYDTSTAAADVAAIAGHLGLTDAVVAGQSWGGNVTVQLAARHPSVVARLVLVDGGWLNLSEEFEDWSECERRLRPPDVDGLPAAQLRAYLEGEHPDWSAEAVAATLASLHIGPDGLVARRLTIEHHMRIVRSMWDDPPQRYFADIVAPVLLLPALAADPAAADRRRTAVVKAATALARARVKEYVGADHDLHAQHPAEVSADLLSFATEG